MYRAVQESIYAPTRMYSAKSWTKYKKKKTYMYMVKLCKIFALLLNQQ
jgi:hypothetical protein